MTKSFYGKLGPQQYLTEVNRFVPDYERISDRVIFGVMSYGSSKILDVGPGVGNLDARILAALRPANIIAVEPSEEMAATAEERLQAYGNRVSIVRQPIENFQPSQKDLGLHSPA